MDQEFRVGKTPADNRMIGKMVKMSMRQPQADDIPAMFNSFVQQWSNGIIRRIKDHRLFGDFVGDHVRVGHRHPACVGQNLHAVM